MGAAALAVLFVTSLNTSPIPGAIQKEEVEYQEAIFKQWWDADLVWKFDELPSEGKVDDHRRPYSGHDYPDRGGGTINAMRKYDQAFHEGRGLATGYEQQDTKTGGERGIFGRRERGLFWRVRQANMRRRIPGWYGHCNGWTAAAIRHAEPVKNVTRNGVVFTPADIKGLLAEIYMYNDHEFLGGIDTVINPGTMHVVLANWLGNGGHPIGLETAVGRTVFNYPAFSYTSTSNKLSDTEVEVTMNVEYVQSTTQEFDKGPELSKSLYFHYSLQLDEKGNIVGGVYYTDSAQIDMLWTPLQPRQGGKEGNEIGNPHVDVKEVLAIWRESAPEELRKKWYNIDPTEEDRILDDDDAVETVETAGEVPATTVSTSTTESEEDNDSQTEVDRSDGDSSDNG